MKIMIENWVASIESLRSTAELYLGLKIRMAYGIGLGHVRTAMAPQCEPLAWYLCAPEKDYDLPSAMELSKNCKDFFQGSEKALNEMLCDAGELADEIDMLANFELTQPRHRVSKKEC
ncbi:hypothetical protein TNCV_929431 [Trichonephila clavipes]|nr:hypothetical protein TNCV_929431 [Trichonephila clavipes]